MGGGIKNTNNSFTLNIRNNNYDVQPISLFSLGTSGSGVPLGLGGSGGNQQTFLVVQDAPTDAIGFVPTNYFTYLGGTPDGTNIVVKEGTDMSISLSDSTSAILNPALAPNMTLNALNTQLESTTGFTASNSLESKNITLSVVANIFEGVLIGITFYSQHEGINILQIILTNATSGATTIPLTSGTAEETSGTATPNNVWVSAPNGNATSQPTYNEINQAQNGSVFDITSMSIETKEVPNVENQVPQLLQPITFSSVDVDGKEEQKAVVPTIDPNQIQNSLGDIQLDDGNNGVNYQLDGETALQMNLEGLANINLTLNYVQLPNLVAGTSFGIQQALQEQAQLQQEAKDNNFKRKIKLSKKSVKALQDDVKKKSPYHHLQSHHSFQTMCGFSLEYSLLPMY